MKSNSLSLAEFQTKLYAEYEHMHEYDHDTRTNAKDVGITSNILFVFFYPFISPKIKPAKAFGARGMPTLENVQE